MTSQDKEHHLPCRLLSLCGCLFMLIWLLPHMGCSLSLSCHLQGLLLCLCRARVKGEADLTHQQLPVGLQPGQQVAIKQVQDADQEVPRALAEREEAVLKSLADKPYAPKLYACYHSQEVDASSGSVLECANLLME